MYDKSILVLDHSTSMINNWLSPNRTEWFFGWLKVEVPTGYIDGTDGGCSVDRKVRKMSVQPSVSLGVVSRGG